MPRRRFAFTVLSGALLVTGSAAFAQNGARNPAPAAGAGVPVTAPAPPAPTAPAINILLLAIDQVPPPGTKLPATVAVTPDTPPPPGGVAPAITPARFNVSELTPFWTTSAKAKPKDPDADLFRMEPDHGTTLPGPNVPPVATPSANDLPYLPLPANDAPLTPIAPPGRAQLTALPLRRALLALGWGDVFPTSMDAAAITRAVGERRLTPRTLEALKNAISDLSVPGAARSPDATQRATVAASRVGQALGYRAVVAFYVSPATDQNGTQNASFSFILADSARETGEPILFDEKGTDQNSLQNAGGSTGAALLDKTLRTWPDVTPADRAALAQKHLDAAHAFINTGDTVSAQDELNQTIALDGKRGEAYVLMGDVLASTDPVGAANAYRRAVELNAQDGATWAKIAIAYTTGNTPDWPRALDASRKALATSYDSVPLRVAIATAQFGRADLFRKADRLDRAEDAEFEARKSLDRALELAPDDPNAVRLLARQLVQSGRYEEATKTLDRVAPRYPKDIEIQTQYAAALAGQTGREEDAFAVYSHLWKLTGVKSVDLDPLDYAALAQGFDSHVYNIGKSAVQLTTGVANGALPREDALIQLTKLKEDMSEAENGINILRVPASADAAAAASRVFAADLMGQALEAQQIYLETGQELQRLRGSQLSTQATARLNAARTAR